MGDQMAKGKINEFERKRERDGARATFSPLSWQHGNCERLRGLSLITERKMREERELRELRLGPNVLRFTKVNTYHHGTFSFQSGRLKCLWCLKCRCVVRRLARSGSSTCWLRSCILVGCQPGRM